MVRAANNGVVRRVSDGSLSWYRSVVDGIVSTSALSWKLILPIVSPAFFCSSLVSPER